MRRIVAIMVCMVLFFGLGLQVASAQNAEMLLRYNNQTASYRGSIFHVAIDGKVIDMPIPPVVLEAGRSIVCVREVFEAMGAKVSWSQGQTSRVLISMNDKTVSLAINSTTTYVNDRAVEMEVPARLVSYNSIDKTMVPIRFVSETLGMDVDFLNSTNTIVIKKPTPTPTPTSIPVETTKPGVTLSVVSLSTSMQDNGLIATVKLSAPLNQYELFSLTSPNRVVLDLLGAVNSLPLSEYATNHANIEKIRIAGHGDKVRIVFDSKTLTDYKLEQTDDKKTIKIIFDVQSEKRAVVIDAGHGGSDPGAIGVGNDGKAVHEKDINLAVSLQVIQYLQDAGVTVYATRTTDKAVELGERTTYANNNNADLFVSIHCNSYTTSQVDGSLVLYHTTKDTSTYGITGATLAKNIQTKVVDALRTRDRGLQNGDKMYVIRNANMPSVIVEMAFISNESDRKLLTDRISQTKVARAIADGIIDSLQMMD